jgi:hypothetical protein
MATQEVQQEPKLTIQEYWKDFPEAPFSDTFKWIDADGFEHMTTVRGWTDKSLNEGITRAKGMIDYNGGKPSGRPSQVAPAAQAAPVMVAMRDENGTPMVDQNHEPLIEKIDGANKYTVKGLFHGKTKNGKDYLGVQTIESPHNRKWGVKCFHPNGINEWKSWPLSENEPVVYAPPANAKFVIIREAQGEGKFPDVVEFQA